MKAIFTLTFGIFCLLGASKCSKFEPVTHVIFDLDGTLLDTEACYQEAVNNVTMHYVNKPFTWQDKTLLIPFGLVRDAPKVIKAFNLPLTPTEYSDMVQSMVNECVQDKDFMPGAVEIVEYFHQNHIPMAVCSGTESYNFKIKVQSHGDFFEVGKYFQLIVSAGNDPHVPNSKPAPDPYLYTMSLFSPKPKSAKNVLAFEDTPSGVMSATRAGAQCAWIQDPRVDYGNATFNETIRLKNLFEFEPELFGLPPWRRPKKAFEDSGQLLRSPNFVRMG